MHNKRVLYPFLALLFTTAALALVFFTGFLNSSLFVRLMQGPTASIHSLPAWLQFCLMHPALLKTLGRLGFGFSMLGSMLTLFLLLRTESPEVAFKHLAEIGWAVIVITGLFFGLLFVPIFIQLVSVQQSFGLWGGAALNSLLIDFGKATLVIGALAFIVTALITSFAKIIGRLQVFAPARQSPHVLQ